MKNARRQRVPHAVVVRGEDVRYRATKTDERKRGRRVVGVRVDQIEFVCCPPHMAPQRGRHRVVPRPAGWEPPYGDSAALDESLTPQASLRGPDLDIDAERGQSVAQPSDDRLDASEVRRVAGCDDG